MRWPWVAEREHLLARIARLERALGMATPRELAPLGGVKSGERP